MCRVFLYLLVMKKIIPGLNIPVNSIFCIGRNYANHAKEMNAPLPESPMVFIKPVSTICFNGTTIRLPHQSEEIHHEAELVIAIGKDGKNISKVSALDHIAGFGVGIDFTARDLQASAKKKGHPWSVAKGFDQFAPISEFNPLNEINLQDQQILLTVNGETRQNGSTSDMIFDVATLISYLSTIFTLSEGDLIFTGTPEGVSAVQSSDVIVASLPNAEISLTVSIA